MVKHNTHIIGGAGGIGRWMIKYVFTRFSNIYSYDVNEKALNDLPENVIKCNIIAKDSYKQYEQNFKHSDWILLATPLHELESTLRNINPFIKEETLLVTLSSVQQPAINIIKKYIPYGSNYLGCHPLFGNTVPVSAGQLVVLTEFDQRIKQHNDFQSALSNAGLISTRLQANEHDDYMGIVQALTHFSFLVFANTIIKSEFAPSTLFKVRTTNFQFLYAFASRVLKIAPTTIGSIQNTKRASQIRGSFLEVARELHKKFNLSPNSESCARIIEGIREPFSGAEVEAGTEVAGIAVESLQRFEALLHKYRKSRAIFVFCHRTSDKIHVVQIVRITHDEVFFKESIRTISSDGKIQFAIGLSENACQNYRKMGINLQKPKEHKIKKQNIKLLTNEELKEFLEEKILSIQLLQNFENKYNLKEDFFEKWLPLLVNGLIKCEFVEAYRKRNEIEKVTLKLTFKSEFTREEITNMIQRIITKQTFY